MMSALSKTRLARLHDALAAHVSPTGVPGIVALVSCTTAVSGAGSVSFLRGNADGSFASSFALQLGSIIPSRIVIADIMQRGRSLDATEQSVLRADDLRQHAEQRQHDTEQDAREHTQREHAGLMADRITDPA